MKMKISPIYLFISANFVATIVAYYIKCYETFSLCLITNTAVESKSKLIQSSAVKWCNNHSSLLAIITNETVQSAIEDFIGDSSAKLEDSDVITDGYRYIENNWNWINRKQSEIYPSSNVDRIYQYAYLVVSTSSIYVSFFGQATSTKKFICSYLNQDSSCPDGDIQFRGRCYTIHSKKVTWFDARSICLKAEGRDLATYEDGLPSIASEWGGREEYWIGLRRERWAWYNGLTYYAEIKYYNWDDGKPSATGGQCLCLRAGKWKNCDCFGEYRYVCIQATTTKNNFSSILLTTYSTPAAISTVGDSNSQFQLTPTSQNPPLDMEKPENLGMLIGLGVGSAFLLILIIVIAVVCFIKNRRSRSGDVGPRHGDPKPPTMHNDDAPNTVYAVVMPNDDEPVRSPSEKTSNQTVYADLDLEPKRKVAKRASEPVRSPSKKTPNDTVYEDLDLAPRGNTLGRAEPESEYANSSLVDSVYANSAQTKV